jgi:hypothetical protein
VFETEAAWFVAAITTGAFADATSTASFFTRIMDAVCPRKPPVVGR